MHSTPGRGRFVALAFAAVAPALAACSGGRAGAPRADEGAPSTATSPALADVSQSFVQRGPRVDGSRAESSLSLRTLPDRTASLDTGAPRPLRRLRPLAPHAPSLDLDPFLQKELPVVNMPAATVNFLGQGITNDAATMTGTPPDPNGAVGPNHYVQVVNGGIAIWNKTGTVAAASKLLNSLWSGYTGTHPGNGCAADNDGDPVVLYDQLADRWFVSQFSLPNPNSGPNFQCVAVSKTGDPTGAYWLYDFQYAGLNDYGKFGVWTDAYYATFNMFSNAHNGDSDFCAYDRVRMLAGTFTEQQCFQQGPNVSGALPVNVDGQVPPPRGEPGFFVQLSNATSLDLFKFHVDWTTPGNSTLTGPTNIAVTAYTPLCNNTGTCVPQPSPGNQLDSLSDRLMFRLTYRNFGTYEALMVNHSVDTGGVGGVRWYELRAPNGTPVVQQQGTYAPADGNWRWMGSLAEDQAEDFALGFSVSSSTQFASIGWTGRLSTDPPSTMGQGETIIDDGTGVETGKFSDGTPATRWGDYSDLTIDPSDDCTFWYTQELYHQTGPIPKTWDTEIASVRFPSCAANDFTLLVTPGSQAVNRGFQVTYTVTSTLAKGTAETLVLNIQDLPSGVTGAFMPTSIVAGGIATLTLTAAATAPITSAPVTFTVIGKAPSAVHPATAQVSVGGCTPLTMCPAPDNCGTIADGCGGMLSCGTCTLPQTCGGSGTANVCGCMPMSMCAAGLDCGSVPDGCGGMVSCGGPCVMPQTCGGGGTPNKCGCIPKMCPSAQSCGTPPDGCGGQLNCGGCPADQTCTNFLCVAGAPDSGTDGASSMDSGAGDSGSGADSGAGDAGNPLFDSGAGGDAGGDGGNGATPGDSGGCGCRTARAPSMPALGLGGVGALGAIGALRRRRRRRA